jgi:hypothetical protein
MLKVILTGLLLAVACGSHKTAQRTTGDAGAAPVPLDRLLPSELGQSGALVFGFPIPPGMRVTRRYPDSVYLQGPGSATTLKEYIEGHVVAGPSEVDGHRRTYSGTRIRGGDASRVYRIELDDLRGSRQIIITDTTPKSVEPGLSNEERWKRAGFLPDGTPIPSAQSM